MNNDNDLSLHSMTKLSGWLRYCLKVKMKSVQANLKEWTIRYPGRGAVRSKKKIHARD